MEHSDHSAAGTYPESSHGSELINRSIIEIITAAWNRYPSEVPLPRPSTVDQELLGQVLNLLDQEGVVQLTDDSIALTDSGYAAVEQAGHTNRRFAEVLQGGTLSDEVPNNSSIVLAILRAHFEATTSLSKVRGPGSS